MYYALMFFIPILIVAGIVKLYFKWKYTWAEFGIQIGATFVVLAGLFLAVNAYQTSDYKIVNGVVNKLDPNKQSCPNGWRSIRDGHCTEYRTRKVYSHTTCSGTGNSKSCTRHYDTEYKYIYDWERRYFVKTDLNNTYEISRIDRQGANVPPRFAEINLGDPVSITVNYTNYIKGAADSLFAEEKPIEPSPIAYPKIRDYYKAYRVIFTGTTPDSELYVKWNESLAVVNSNIRKTGGNVIVVLTDSKNADLPEALARNWDAHNINDVVTVIGRSNNTVNWVDVRSWSDNSLVNVEIENEIMNLKTLDSVKINAILEQAMTKHFEEKPMDDFEYLADDIAPPTWAFIIAAFILLVITPLVTYVFHKHDIA
jgi:hypothetical protein